MDIKIREKLLRERNASIEIANVEPRPRPPSECSSISSVNTRGSRETVMSMNEDRICKSPKKSPKKVNLAVVKQRKKEQGNLELLKTLDEYKRENNRLSDEVKKLIKDKEGVQTQLALKLKYEEKVKAEIESNSLKMREAINETSMLRTICERQERELKQRDSSSRSDGVRLIRQDEQITKLKVERQKLEENVAALREELRTLKELHQKHVNLKDKQIEQLLDGFQKQMQLIDVLRRQKLHLEAAHVLQYTEDEFLKTLDWKPFGNEDSRSMVVNNPSG